MIIVVIVGVPAEVAKNCDREFRDVGFEDGVDNNLFCS